MGRPTHYSADIPSRCRALIEVLMKHVEEDSDPEGLWGGPLKTTFLLAMATPMLVLPMERIFMPVVEGRRGLADDADLDSALSAELGEVLGPGRLFELAPFFEAGAWRFVPHCEFFEVGGDWPPEKLAELSSDKAEVSVAVDQLTTPFGSTYVNWLKDNHGNLHRILAESQLPISACS